MYATQSKETSKLNFYTSYFLYILHHIYQCLFYIQVCSLPAMHWKSPEMWKMAYFALFFIFFFYQTWILINPYLDIITPNQNPILKLKSFSIQKAQTFWFWHNFHFWPFFMYKQCKINDMKLFRLRNWAWTLTPYNFIRDPDAYFHLYLMIDSDKDTKYVDMYLFRSWARWQNRALMHVLLIFTGQCFNPTIFDCY